MSENERPLEVGEQVTIGWTGRVVWTVQRYENRRGDLRLINEKAPADAVAGARTRVIPRHKIDRLRRVNGGPSPCPKPREDQ